MISHDRAQELISARMDAPLTPAEHRELQGHLASCTSCRVFVSQSDDLARGLHAMPRLAPSPEVSRAVLSTVYAESSGLLWLQRALQALSSPGLAVASGLALVLALAGALMIALNAPGSSVGIAPEATFEVAAVPDIPTQAPTATLAPEPTATKAPARVIAEPTARPARTPAPRPTATSVPIVAAENPPVDGGVDAPAVVVQEPIIEPVAEEPILAMAAEDTGEIASADMAQTAEAPALAQDAPVSAEATNGGGSGGGEPEKSGDRRSGRKDGGDKGKDAAAAAAAPEQIEPQPTHEIAPLVLPREAITAMEEAGTAPDVILPPAPLDPMLPPQDFLPMTPTPVSDGTPTPASDGQESVPQLADDWSDELPVTALAPDAPAEVTDGENEQEKDRGKRDKSNKEGKSHEEQQAAYSNDPLGWSADSVALSQVIADPLLQPQTAEDPALAETTTDETAETATADPAAEQPRQIDPATGLEIDPLSGLLIDPNTGYLIDIANGRIVDPRTGYLVDPMTGLLVDPATGALLDPNTLAIVVPAGFGSDQPAYVPGSPEMRDSIEAVVDNTYDDATYKVIPATDGPVQPVGEIVVPTASGDAVEIQ